MTSFEGQVKGQRAKLYFKGGTLDVGMDFYGCISTPPCAKYFVLLARIKQLPMLSLDL